MVKVTKEADVLGPQSKADAVYVELRNRILLGILRAGERLDQELLAESLGVSTTPMREALRRLEADRLVVRTAHRDVAIASTSVIEARELFTVRLELDTMAIALATKYMSDEELSLAEEVLEAPLELASTYLRERGIVHKRGMAKGRAFHHILYSGSHNQVLIEALDGLWARTERYAFLALGLGESPANALPHAVRVEAGDPKEEVVIEGSPEVASEHRSMLAAIARHDVEAAKALMRTHYTVAEAVEQFLLGPVPRIRPISTPVEIPSDRHAAFSPFRSYCG